jgi:tetratricopeptide (TPR) repeat protein
MSGNQDRYQQAINQGHSAAWDQDWERAAMFYQQALDEFPDHPKALASLGLALVELQRYEDALTYYHRAATVVPTDPMPLEKIAQICERLGRPNDAIQASMQAADLYVKNKDLERAIDNWTRVTGYNPDHLIAQSRLAVTYERLGRKSEAVESYLAVASIVQRSGDGAKAAQAVHYALQIQPDNPVARNALAMINASQLLPRPVRPRGNTAPLRAAQVRQMEVETSEKSQEAGLDPIGEARGQALIMLADILFEGTGDHDQRGNRRGAGSILKDNSEQSMDEGTKVEMLRHLGQAIDAQTQGEDAKAAEDLNLAIEAGLTNPAAYFDLALLNLTNNQDHPEVAIRDLQAAVQHPSFAIGARLLLGQTFMKIGKLVEASTEYLEALKLADTQTAPAEVAETIDQLYEPLVATEPQGKDDKELTQLCKNIDGLMMQKNWRARLVAARAQMPAQEEGSAPLLLVEMLLQVHDNQVVESMTTIRKLIEKKMLRTAMEEAYTALISAPTFLPLHILIGEILLQEGHLNEATTKFSVIAQSYSVRGEANQACVLLRRLVTLAPSDLGVRQQLIDQLVISGQTDEAIRAYLELADIYYRQADLELARDTYMTTLHLAQSSPSTHHEWGIEIMNRIADIDMQRLDLRQALRVYEQIRTMAPEDAKTRMNIIALNYRMGQETPALNEMQNFVGFLEGKGQRAEAATFLHNLMEEHPELNELRKRLVAKNAAA